MSIASTHTIRFVCEITQHGVEGEKVVSSEFWGFRGEYGNCPIEMVNAVQGRGIDFLGELHVLGEQWAANKIGNESDKNTGKE